MPAEREKWFSRLTGKYPSDEDIAFALETFSELKMENIKAYMMFYLRVDVLLLLEVYEAFRELALVSHLFIFT